MDYCKIIKTDNTTFVAFAPAKLNIDLFIGNTDSSGMHEITSIMQAISLHDTITLSIFNSGGIHISGFVIKDNILLKALSVLQKHIGKELNCLIRVDKSIPIGAGMGGGSSDAAAVLRLANVAFGLGLDIIELESIASNIGNDVAFLLHGGRAKVGGSLKHNIIEMDVPNINYLIARPNMELSTKTMYKLHDESGKSFKELASDLCPDTKRLLFDLSKTSPIEFGITGKGPTVFAGYKRYNECIAAMESINWFKDDIFIEHSIGKFE